MSLKALVGAASAAGGGAAAVPGPFAAGQCSETADCYPCDVYPCRPFGASSTFASPASNQQIAEELHLSIDGVKTHLRALFRKLAVPDVGHNQKRLRLAQRAMEAGIVGERDLR